MAILVHRYDAPDRFVAGTVGQPGERTFFLQAREGNRITSVACEKQQVSVLAEHLDRVLDEVVRRSAGEVNVPPASAQGPRHRPAGRADHRGVPGRHHDHRLGPQHRPDRHRAVLQRRHRGGRGRGRSGRGRRRRPRRTRSTPTRCSSSRSPPPTPGTSSRGRKPWSPRAGRRARSACSRWIRTDTSARGPTATAARCSADA